jgi:hypothetical protein
VATSRSYWRQLGTWPALGIPLAVYLGAQALAPLAAQGQFSDLSCVRTAATFLFRLSYGAVGIPVAVALALLVAAAAFFWQRRRVRPAALALLMAGLLAAGYLLGVGRWPLLDTPARVSCAGMEGTTYRAVGCWENASTYEMNVVPSQPFPSEAELAAVGRDLRRHRRDKYLFEAFVFPHDAPPFHRSNAEWFVLAREQLSLFGNVCRQEREAAAAGVAAARLAFYRFSDQQRPPVDAFFVPGGGPAQFLVSDYTHDLVLDFRAPASMSSEERAYIDRVRAATGRLNADLDEETGASPARRAEAVARMRADWTAQGTALEAGIPARMVPFAGSRVRRFFANYELLILSEEQTLQLPTSPSPATTRIHSRAFQEHRTYFFQEPQAVEPIAYLYLNRYPETFSDDVLSVVSWGMF